VGRPVGSKGRTSEKDVDYIVSSAHMEDSQVRKQRRPCLRPRIEVTHSIDRHHNLAQGRHREAEWSVHILLISDVDKHTGRMTARTILRISEQAIEVSACTWVKFMSR
jgi:hypothetical protein